MKRFKFLLKLFRFNYSLLDSIYLVYPKYEINKLNRFYFNVGVFIDLLKYTSVKSDHCKVFMCKEDVEIWLEAAIYGEYKND